ncbi:class D sortase [Aquibacillus albus]|uniref:Sortase A n=1 Tax=Aquibacillus albus TaxID=1168171 RepID=A0ABS2MWJ9_9BACI|nr:class D sortase [Aquibacillus albus]MBM7570268.1 sortase A [Aquibacillus albus]
MNKLAIGFILLGLVISGIGGYQFLQAKAAEKNSLTEARSLIEKPASSPKEKKDPIETIENFNPKVGETIGILEIPSIGAELPIIEGTDPEELEKGVGHFKGSAFPTQQDQIVLSGHRDTVFRKLGEVQIGDQFLVHLPYGTFTYEMVDYRIVDADDRTVIKSTAPEEVMLLTTCYPFSYVGDAPDRYVISAKPVDKENLASAKP